MKGLIIGAPNSGKTTFLINFSAFLGLRELQLQNYLPEKKAISHALSLPLAQKTLIADTPHTTRLIQGVTLRLPQGKRGKDLELLDTCGLVKGIHPTGEVRRAMAQTIDFLLSSVLVLHLIDLSIFPGHLPVIDRELWGFLREKKGYAILANKIDLEEALFYLPALRKEATPVPVFPISAIQSRGFKEVYNFVLGCL